MLKLHYKTHKYISESSIEGPINKTDFELAKQDIDECIRSTFYGDPQGYRETIKDNVTGFLTDFDPQEIANKIMYILNNPDRAEEMGNSGRRWIEEQWTWSIQIKNLEKILMDWAKNKS